MGDNDGPVVLISMPWLLPDRPSIQTGLLAAAMQEGLDQEPIQLAAHVDWFEAVCSRMALTPDLAMGLFSQLTSELHPFFPGEWIFTKALGIPDNAEEYWALLKTANVGHDILDRISVLRDLAPEFVAEVTSEALSHAPSIVGLSATLTQLIPSLSVAKRIKQESPKTCVVMGGGSCDGSMADGLLRCFDFLDIVVSGQGEEALLDIVRQKQSRGAMPRRVIRPPITTNYRPRVPLYAPFFERLESSRFKDFLSLHVQTPVEAGRGCWWGAKHHCIFCGLNGSGLAFRSGGPKSLVDQMDSLSKQFGVRDFFVVDNLLGNDLLRNDVASLGASERDFSWFVEVKSNLRRGQLELLKNAGVHELQPEIESLDDSILEHMDKGVTTYQNIRFLLDSAELGIRVHWNILLGLPGESVFALANIAALIPSLVHLSPPQAGDLQINRFSPLFNRPQDYGLVLEGPAKGFKHLFDLPVSDVEEFAYVFEHRIPHEGRDIRALRDRIRRRVKVWRASAAQAKLAAYRVNGALRIEDTRPGTGPRVLLLRGVYRKVLMLSFGGRGLRETIGQVASECDVEPEDVRRIVEELADERLLFFDGRSVLALPVREWVKRERSETH